MAKNTLTICFFAPGNNTHTHRWCQAMVEKGHKVILIPRSPCNIIQNEYLKKVKIINVAYPDGVLGKIPKLKSIIRANQLCNITKSINPDIFHIHYMQSGWTTRKLAKANKNTVVSVWGSDVVKMEKVPYLMRKSIERTLRTADLICATTIFLKKETIRFCGNKRRIEVIPFGVDINKFSPAKPKKGKPVIGFLKHLESKYGPEILITAMSKILQLFPEAILIMGGDGSQKQKLKKLAKRLGVEKNLIFAGKIPHKDVPKTINMFTVMAMPSICRESFGVAAIESQACSVPIVATNIGGIPEAIDDGHTGILVKPGDVDSLADAIIQLLKNKSLRDRMGTAGRRYVENRFDWKENVTKMEALYFKLLDTEQRI